jgi:hypothetical protein
MNIDDRLSRIHKRQVARFIAHLKRCGSLTPEMETDVKRAYGFVFSDVLDAVHEHDKEQSDNDTNPNTIRPQ